MAAVPGGVFTNKGTITVEATTSNPASLGPEECGINNGLYYTITCYTVGNGVNNEGTINVVSGTLDLGGFPLQYDSLDTSTILGSPSTIDSGATLNVSSGAVLDIVTIAVLDSGGILSSSGSVVVNGDYGGVSGDFIVDQSLAIPTLTVNGTLAGSANVAVSSLLNINYGTLDTSGTTTIDNGAVATFQRYTSLNAGILINDGLAAIESGSISIAPGASFVNNGSLKLTPGASVGPQYGDSSSFTSSGTAIAAVPGGVFTNKGTITVEATTANPASLGYSSNGNGVNNEGTINVVSGTLDLGGSSVQYDSLDTSTILQSPSTIDSGATLNVSSGAVLDIIGTAVLDSGGILSSSGSVVVDGYFIVDQSVAIPTLTVKGTLAGSANVSVSSSLNMDYGTLDTSGTTAIDNGAVTTFQGFPHLNAGILINNGLAAIGGGGSISIAPGASFVNNGSLKLTPGTSVVPQYGDHSYVVASSGTTIAAVPAGVFTNKGTITVEATTSNPAGLGSAYYNYSGVNNEGTINVVSGTLDLGGSSVQYDSLDTSTILQSPSTIDSGATLSVSSGAVLDITGTAVLDSGGILSSSGSVVVDGRFIVDQSVAIPTLTVNGTLVIGQSVVVSSNEYLSNGGTIQLDSETPGQFGKLLISDKADLSYYRLYLQTTYPLSCGMTVVAIQASGIINSWSSIGYNSSLPSGNLQSSLDATTAGVYVYCPPPPVSAAQTAGTGSSIDALNPSVDVAEPVNTDTGAYSTVETDAKLSGNGVPFTFTRSYTSTDTSSGPFGIGWTDSMNVTAIASGANVTVTDGNGQQVIFNLQSNGSYVGPPGTISQLTAISGGGWLLVRHDQTHLTFNSAGQLISEVNRNGIGLSLSYNSAGQLISVTDYEGHVVTFTYNTAGEVASMNFPSNRSVTYSYNSAGQLTTVTDALGGVTTYTYNTAGLLTIITDQNGHRVVENTYNSAGQVISQVNALGKTATFAYDSSTGVTTYTDPDGNVWKYMYVNNVLVEKINPLGGVTSYTYNPNLEIVAVTNPDEYTTLMSYDNSDNMLSEITPLGATKTWTYDSMNDVTSYTDPLGNTTNYTYNAHGNLIKTVLPNGATTTVIRNSTTGMPIAVTDPLGNTTNYSYNSVGQLIKMTSPDGGNTTYSYDSAGRLVSVTNPLGNTTTYTYNTLDELTSVTNSLGDVTTYGYDPVGNKTSITDANGNTTTYSYDAANHLISVTNAEGGVTSYTYNANGNKTSVTDENGNTTTYSYDSAGRLVSVTNPLGNTTTYAYDPVGNRILVTEPDGTTVTTTYNGDNLPTKVSYSDGTPTVTFTYDQDGRKISMTDGTGTTTYTYNSVGNLLSVKAPSGNYAYTYDLDGNVISRTYPDGTTVTYTYNGNGLQASLASGSISATFTYDLANELTGIALPVANGYTETYTYDGAGRVTSVVDQNAGSTLSSYTYSYDPAGNPTSVTINGQLDTYTYDQLNRITNVCYAKSCSGGDIGYSYDPVGNLTAVDQNSSITKYAYNAADQITSATSPTGVINYTYNVNGERTAAGSTAYTWNAAGEMTSLTSGSATTTYLYNGVGTRTSATMGSSTTSYSYDVNNSLPELVLESNGAGLVEREIFGAGKLISISTQSGNYYVGHDALGSVVALTNATGVGEETYTYTPFGERLTTTILNNNAPSIDVAFESQLLDPSGLYSIGARELDPMTGSFLSEDPLMASVMSPAVSPYVYAKDQPTFFEDLSGEHAWPTKSIENGALGALGNAGTAISIGEAGSNLVSNCAGQSYSSNCRVAAMQSGLNISITVAGGAVGSLGGPLGEAAMGVVTGAVSSSADQYIGSTYYGIENAQYYQGSIGQAQNILDSAVGTNVMNTMFPFLSSNSGYSGIAPSK